MRFYDENDCESWLLGRNRKRPEAGPDCQVIRIAYPTEPYRFFYYAQWVAKSLTFRMPVLLWINETGIWSSSENWHLYYKLRQSYGDARLLSEAPGHLFLEHESEDLASFLQLAILNGWGGYLLTQADFVNLRFSHDEYFDFFAKDYDLSEIREALGAGASEPIRRIS